MKTPQDLKNMKSILERCTKEIEDLSKNPKIKANVSQVEIKKAMLHKLTQLKEQVNGAIRNAELVKICYFTQI